MNGKIYHRIAMTALLIILSAAFSGCIRRTSDEIVNTYDFLVFPPQGISISNPVGMVEVTGSVTRMSKVDVRVEKQVQTYSLLGLANPDKYGDRVEVYLGLNEEGLSVAVAAKRLPLLERLFVKITPKVNIALSTPVALNTSVEVNVGSVEIHNIVGNLDASVNVGEMKISSSLGILGNQNLAVDIGNLDLRLPADTAIRYDLETSMGSIETSGFNAEVERRLLGARTTGVNNASLTPSFVKGRVNIGQIEFHGE